MSSQMVQSCLGKWTLSLVGLTWLLNTIDFYDILLLVCILRLVFESKLYKLISNGVALLSTKMGVCRRYWFDFQEYFSARVRMTSPIGTLHAQWDSTKDSTGLDKASALIFSFVKSLGPSSKDDVRVTMPRYRSQLFIGMASKVSTMSWWLICLALHWRSTCLRLWHLEISPQRSKNRWILWPRRGYLATRICSTTPTGSSQTSQLHASVSKWLMPLNMFIPEVSCIVISSPRISWCCGCSHPKVFRMNCRGIKVRFPKLVWWWRGRAHGYRCSASDQGAI